MTHYLKFPDETTGLAALDAAGLLDTDEDGNQSPITASLDHALDVADSEKSLTKSLEPEKEVWAAVPGYERMYEVSSFGRVRSLDRDCPHPLWKTQRRKGKFIAPGCSSKYGHLKVNLCKDGAQRSYHLHQLVLAAFVGPRPEGMEEVRHLNGNPGDNRLVNLAYGTRKDNADDARRHGTLKVRGERVSKAKKGIATVWCERHGMARLTADQVRQMKKDFENGMTSAEAGRKYGISQAHACKIKLNQAWSKLEAA